MVRASVMCTLNALVMCAQMCFTIDAAPAWASCLTFFLRSQLSHTRQHARCPRLRMYALKDMAYGVRVASTIAHCIALLG